MRNLPTVPRDRRDELTSGAEVEVGDTLEELRAAIRDNFDPDALLEIHEVDCPAEPCRGCEVEYIRAGEFAPKVSA